MTLSVHSAGFFCKVFIQSACVRLALFSANSHLFRSDYNKSPASSIHVSGPQIAHISLIKRSEPVQKSSLSLGKFMRRLTQPYVRLLSLSEWLCGLVLCVTAVNKSLFIVLQSGFLKSSLRRLRWCQLLSTDICCRSRTDLVTLDKSFSQSGQFWFCQHRRQSLPLFILQTWPIASRVWSVIRPLVFRVEEDDAEKDDVAASACACRGSEDSPHLTVACYLTLSCSEWKLAGKGPSWQSLQKFWALDESNGTWLEQVSKVT